MYFFKIGGIRQALKFRRTQDSVLEFETKEVIRGAPEKLRKLIEKEKQSKAAAATAAVTAASVAMANDVACQAQKEAKATESSKWWSPWFRARA